MVFFTRYSSKSSILIASAFAALVLHQNVISALNLRNISQKSIANGQYKSLGTTTTTTVPLKPSCAFIAPRFQWCSSYPYAKASNLRCSTSLNTLTKSEEILRESWHDNGGTLLSKLWSIIKRLFSAGKASERTYNSLGLNHSGAAAKYYIPISTSSTISPSNFKSLSLFNIANQGYSGSEEGLELDPKKPHIMSKDSAYSSLIRSTPSEIITMFLEKAPQRVKEAVRATVGSLVGSFYRYSVETTIITTSERLASLIYNLQMTGYMLCNAEYRYCLSQHFTSDPITQSSSQAAKNIPKNDDILEGNRDNLSDPSYKDDELARSGMADGDDLLSYIKRLPEKNANSLFENISNAVVDAMKVSTDATIEALTAGAVSSQFNNVAHAPRVIIQQTGTSTMQLCFWQLALGYCLREQEAKLELHSALNGP